MKVKLNYFFIPLVTLAVAFAGSWVTTQGMGWYAALRLPSWTPSGGSIGLVWTIIFILSTASALIVWNAATRPKKFSWIAGLFAANAFLNYFWSQLFFGWHHIGLSIAEMIVLEITVLALAVLIWPRSRLASLLLWPYAGWVLFATYLALSVFFIN
jgi:benzodiazapine receptor